MIATGCDIGMLATKAVVLDMDARRLLAYHTVPTRAAPEHAAHQSIQNATAAAGLGPDDIDSCTVTGWGRKKYTAADRVSGIVPCLINGVRWLNPDVKAIMDVGGQTINLILLNDRGKMQDHATNDRCAAGTGKFIEIMADALEVAVEDIGSLSLESGNHIPISNQCVVFAESEIISLVSRGEALADIAGSIHQSIVNRLITMANRIGISRPLCVTGGVAKNPGIVKRLEKALGFPITRVPEDPQIVAALGAAVKGAR